MCESQLFDPLLQFVEEFYKYVFDTSSLAAWLKYSNKIRLHNKNLDKTGDLNFPLRLHNWRHWIKNNLPLEEADKYSTLDDTATIFELSKHDSEDIDEHLNELLSTLNKRASILKLREERLQEHNVHLCFDRFAVFCLVVGRVISEGSQFGCSRMINYKITLNESLRQKSFDSMNLTDLRTLILENFTYKLLDYVTDTTMETQTCQWSHKSSVKHENLVCGPVLNEAGAKEVTTRAEQLLNKRSEDMRSMAEHRYGYRQNCASTLEEYKSYFDKLGKAAVTIEMLEQKPNKGVKILLKRCSSTHKGPVFIFYNCARLGVLLEKYNKKVEEGKYPALPPIEEINFKLLKESEEWELLYVYILQFPSVIRSCISVDEASRKLEILPQNLVMFLSRLSCVFSTYYRRIKILMDTREHLFPTVHARLYLLKALQVVFHNALSLLDIEPVTRM